MEFKKHAWKKDALLTGLLLVLSAILLCLPTGFDQRVNQDSIRCQGLVLKADNSGLQRMGIIKKGYQDLVLKALDGPLKGQVLKGSNQLQGRMDLDKIFTPGDKALMVVSLDDQGRVVFVNPQDHYRLDLELILLGLFALLLIAFGGFTGLKALLSFVFAGLMLWKLLVPLLLKGLDPVLISLAVISLLTAVIVFLVAGINQKGVTAFLGAFCGVGVSCLLALYFTAAFKVHGAVMPFAETLLYSGFGHLDLMRIYVAAVFLAASGAVMDLAMDVAASLDEVHAQNPEMGFAKLAFSGLRVGRAVVGTMTTTLLLAYSGGFLTLFMAFMAQGVPLANFFNLIYVAAEVLKTLVGSFGLVTVAPFTAVIGAFIYTRKPVSLRAKSENSSLKQA